MTDMQSIKSTLKKIAALAERGVGGERENAQRKLAALLAKYGLTMDDLSPEKLQEKQWRRFTFKSKEEREILLQCYFRVTNTNECMYHPRRGSLSFELTAMDAAELERLWAHHKKLWRKELSRLKQAFIWKHKLHSDHPAEADDNDEPMSPEEYDALCRLMYGMEKSNYISPRHMLEAPK